MAGLFNRLKQSVTSLGRPKPGNVLMVTQAPDGGQQETNNAGITEGHGEKPCDVVIDIGAGGEKGKEAGDKQAGNKTNTLVESEKEADGHGIEERDNNDKNKQYLAKPKKMISNEDELKMKNNDKIKHSNVLEENITEECGYVKEVTEERNITVMSKKLRIRREAWAENNPGKKSQIPRRLNGKKQKKKRQMKNKEEGNEEGNGDITVSTETVSISKKKPKKKRHKKQKSKSNIDRKTGPEENATPLRNSHEETGINNEGSGLEVGPVQNSLIVKNQTGKDVGRMEPDVIEDSVPKQDAKKSKKRNTKRKTKKGKKTTNLYGMKPKQPLQEQKGVESHIAAAGDMGKDQKEKIHGLESHFQEGSDTNITNTTDITDKINKDKEKTDRDVYATSSAKKESSIPNMFSRMLRHIRSTCGILNPRRKSLASLKQDHEDKKEDEENTTSNKQNKHLGDVKIDIEKINEGPTLALNEQEDKRMENKENGNLNTDNEKGNFYKTGVPEDTSWARNRTEKRKQEREQLDKELSAKSAEFGLSPKVLAQIMREDDMFDRAIMIKSLPVPMASRRLARTKLASERVDQLSGWRIWHHKARQKWARFQTEWNEFTVRLEVWRQSLKAVEGTYGSGVVSYFRFLKWLFFLDLAMFLLWTLFVVIPNAAFQPDANAYDNATVSLERQQLSQQCSNNYNVTVSRDPLQVLIDFLQGTGWMEKTALFYGTYSGRPLVSGISLMGDYNLPLAYLTATLVLLGLTLLLMARKTSDSLKASLVRSSRSKMYGYCNLVFGGWDYTLSDDSSAIIRNSVIHNEIAAELDEERQAKRRAQRKLWDWCMLGSQRAAINLMVILLLAVGGFLIYFAQIKTTQLMEGGGYDSAHLLVGLLLEFVPSLTITALNVVLPAVFNLAVKHEDYSPDVAIQITLGRTVFLRLASLAVLVATMYSQITCSPVDQCDVGMPPCPRLYCWETFVGQAIYKLIILNFVTVTGIIVFVEFPRKLIVTHVPWKVVQLVGRQEFEIPKHVIDLVYAQTLCWLGTFFCPLVPGLYVMKLFLMFYLKKLTCMHNYTPTARPYGSARSYVFFMVVLLLAFLLCCVPIGYVLWQLPPSKGCGPFRLHDDSFRVLYIAMKSWPPFLRNTLDFIFSAGFRATLFIILILMAYFYYVAARGRKDMVSLLREQVKLESRDKQFLLMKLNEETGTGPGVNEKRGHKSRLAKKEHQKQGTRAPAHGTTYQTMETTT